MLKTTLAAALGLALTTAAAVQPVLGADAKSITLFSFEDLGEAPFMAEYKAKYGANAKYVKFKDEDDAFAKMRAGYKPDVMGPCSYEFERWKEAGLLRTIDTTKLTHWKDIPQSLRNLPGIMASPTEAWFIPQYWANTSVTYRTDLAPEYVGKESYAILFDPKYKGRVAALDGVDDTVTLIAKTIGVNPYAMSPADWDKVQAKLREFIKHARFITSETATLAQGLASGEIVAAITWNQTHAELRRAGQKVAFMNPPGGMFSYACGLVMHKETKDVEKALALIDSSISKPASKQLLEVLNNGPANVSILADYTDAQMKEFGLPRDVDAFLKTGTFQVRLKNKDAIVKFWTELQTGG